MKMLEVYKNGKLVVPEVEDASTFFRRFMGLMYRKDMAESHGLLLTPCNEIHTFGMKFDIDAITLSRDNEILYIDSKVPPHKARKKIKNGYKVLELCSGEAEKLGFAAGDVLEFKER